LLHDSLTVFTTIFVRRIVLGFEALLAEASTETFDEVATGAVALASDGTAIRRGRRTTLFAAL